MKTCFKCGGEKELTEFYVHPQMADGHLNKCKECAKKDVHERYKEKISNPYFIISERERTRLKYHRLNYKNRPQPKEQKKKIMERYHNKDANKKIAGSKTAYAIRSGKLVRQPCVVCGSADVEAHHEDYSKPLEVVWLCVKHHHDRHVRLREAELIAKFNGDNLCTQL